MIDSGAIMITLLLTTLYRLSFKLPRSAAPTNLGEILNEFLFATQWGTPQSTSANYDQLGQLIMSPAGPEH
jgi:hypothetical protein